MINKVKSWFFGKDNTLDKHLVKSYEKKRKKREEAQIAF